MNPLAFYPGQGLSAPPAGMDSIMWQNINCAGRSVFLEGMKCELPANPPLLSSCTAAAHGVVPAQICCAFAEAWSLCRFRVAWEPSAMLETTPLHSVQSLSSKQEDHYL